MRPNPLLFALIACFACPAALRAAEPQTPDASNAADTGSAELDRIVVVATLVERAVVDLPNTVDAIDRKAMDERLVRDLKDLFRYEPGISVPAGFGRFGIGDIRIRGLGGNRVLIQTDGVPVSDAFSIGSFSNANRNVVDLDTLKQVEVLRGPGSALYGSDALGGVVSFRTKDPEDYLDIDTRTYVGAKLGYESDWNGIFGGATLAGRDGRWSWLVAAGHRQGEAQENRGEDTSDGARRTAPNPQARDGRSVLAKLAYAPSERQRLRLVVDANEDTTDTDVRSGLGFSAFTGATATALLGDDRQSRARVAIEHEIDATDWRWADTLRWSVYRQDSATQQNTDETRITAARVRQRRERSFDFDQRLTGFEALATKDLRFGESDHALSWGIELAQTLTRQKRDGRAINLDTGAITSVIAPDNFPVRDFPNSRSRTAALFVQDEMSFVDGALRVIPALRVDHYALSPQADAIFAVDNPGVALVDLRETSVTPKLGAVWRFASMWSVFFGYARGFRAPPYNDVNIGFTNLAFGYTAIANPDLKPETSDGIESGLRFNSDAAWFSLALYDNRYRDFIESLRFVGVDAAGLQVFQSQNVADARIRGVELKGGVDLGAIAPHLTGWSLRGAAAYAHGQDRSDDRPLDTVDPLRGSVGVAYARERWGVELAGAFASRQRRVSNAALYRPSGYGAWDLFGHWTITQGLRANIGVLNLTDRSYTDWADVPGVSATSATLDRYTRPGRSLALSLAFAW